jgi:ABC transport system ATP-binding/permease protein
MSQTDSKIQVHHNGVRIKKFAFSPGSYQVVIIGRSDQADVVIDSQLISRKHAQLEYTTSGALVITDLGSSNGTYLNGKQISANTPMGVSVGDRINFTRDGKTFLEVTDSRSDSDGGKVKKSGNDQVKDLMSYFGNKETIVIGRLTQSDVVLSGDSISRKHCSISRLGQGKFKLEDLDSLNGTFVNGRKVRGSAIIRANDKILIGRFALSLSGKTRDLGKESAIRTSGVMKKYPDGYVGLQKVSLTVPSKTLLAIMGPSGCGKSTLLKALNGVSPATSGRVFLFEQDLITNYEYLKTQIGYVPQDDIAHSELTVAQSLRYAAKLRLDRPTEEYIEEKIKQLLKDLNIGKIRDSKVSEISGGERKRVCIAIELLTDPLILFLDEPTSPLDPETIEEFLGILQDLSKKGTTVVMVTHKPEDLEYMDEVIFLSEGGSVVYHGCTKNYIQYFKVKKPVQVYKKLKKDSASKWIAKFKMEHPSSGETGHSEQDIRKLSGAKPFDQWRWLTVRYLKIKTNDWRNTLVTIGQAPIIAILICIVFGDVSLAVSFLMAISAIWFGVNNAAREIVGELPIYMRERMFNVQLLPYVFSKLTVLSLFSVVQSVFFVTIIWGRYSGDELNLDNPLQAIIWMVFLSMSASLMGLWLSAASNKTEKVMAVVPIVLIPQIILGGFVAVISNSLVEVISYFTLARWGTEGFSAIQEKVMGVSPEIVDLDKVKVEMNEDSSGIPITDSAGNPEINSIDLGADNTTTRDEVTDAVETLKDQFHDNYTDWFGDWAGTLKLDVFFVVLLSGLFFVGILVALKKKDAIPRKKRHIK